MAGSKPGPAKGSGGRPRKKSGTNKGRVGDGYKRVTVGPKSKGKQVYEHIVKERGPAAAKKGSGKGSKTVVHHKDKRTGNNLRSNLSVMSRAKNAALGRKKKKRSS
jgi:hypothetical protein